MKIDLSIKLSTSYSIDCCYYLKIRNIQTIKKLNFTLCCLFIINNIIIVVINDNDIIISLLLS